MLDEENKHSVYFGGFCQRYAKVYRSRHVPMGSQPDRDVADLLFFANVLLFEGTGARRFTNRGSGAVPTGVARAATAQLDALRRGAGPDVAVMLDVGSNFGLDGAVAMARAIDTIFFWPPLRLRPGRSRNLATSGNTFNACSSASTRSVELRSVLLDSQRLIIRF